MGLQNPAKSLKTQRGRGRSGATATNHECASTNNMVVRLSKVGTTNAVRIMIQYYWRGDVILADGLG